MRMLVRSGKKDSVEDRSCVFDHLPFTGAVWSEVRNRKRLRTDLVLEEHIGHHHPLPVEGEGSDEAHSDDCSSAKER